MEKDYNLTGIYFGKRDKNKNPIKLGDKLQGELWSDDLGDYVLGTVEIAWEENDCRFYPVLIDCSAQVAWPEWDDIEGSFEIIFK